MPSDTQALPGSTAEDIAGRLSAAVARHLGGQGRVDGLARLTGGATKGTYVFEAETAAGREKLILQLTAAAETTDPTAGLTARLMGAQDAAVMSEAARVGVPVPPVRAVLAPDDGLGVGHITGFVAGETLGPKIVRDPGFAAARKAMASQCGSILAAVHRMDAARLPFLITQDAGAQLRAYRAVVDHYGHHLPALEFGLRWVGENLPPAGRVSVVHGDFRTGNLIVGPDGVQAVIDWEICQIGDPMQDLGWYCVKTWRFGGGLPAGGVGTREALFAAYESAGGGPVDPQRVRFWEAFGSVKWAIMCLRKGLRYRDGVEPVNIEQSAIGRRMEEGLFDFLNLIEGRD